MLVFIEYEVDMTTAVVTHTAVQNFSPENVVDFDPIVRYDVWWNGDENTAGGYYKARVLHMAETEEDMALHTSKRLRKPVVSLEKGKKRTKGKPTQATKQLRVQVQQSVEEELLSQIGEVTGPAQHVQKCTCCEQGCAVQAELGRQKQERYELIEQLEQVKKNAAEEAGRLNEKVMELQAQNARLQDALTSKVFASESKIIYATSFGVSVVAGAPGASRGQGANGATVAVPPDQPRPTGVHAKPRTTVAPAAIGQPQSIGYLSEPRTTAAPAPSIQPRSTDYLSKPSTSCTQGQDASISRCGTPEPGITTAMAPMAALSQEHVPEDGYCSQVESGMPNDTADMEISTGEAIDVVIGSSRDDGKVYAGSGQWIEKAAWGTLFRATSDSMFCRMASTMYWTPDQLKNRSVTGTLSNKSRSKGATEARPALTPQKLSSLKSLLRIFMGNDVTPEDEKKRMKDVRRHLAQKLADAQRR